MRAFAAVLLAFSINAAPAAAQIAQTSISMPRNPAGRNSAAFDTTNQVYLVILQTPPVMGVFLDASGVQIGGEFNISPETPIGSSAPFSGWPSVAFGGPSSDPTFLVTYVVADAGTHIKYGRLVRFVPGSPPQVSERTKIVEIGDEWYASEKAQSTWFDDKFIVGTRVKPSGPYPQAELNHFDLSGNVSGGQLLGDSLDFQGSPALACAPEGTCLAVGFAQGAPFGGKGGCYARLFDARTLQPLSGVFYLDDHSANMEDQSVVFNTRTGQFLTAWWRAGYADFRVVSTNGELGPLELDKSFGVGAGDLTLAYNAGTETTLLVSKWSPPPTNEGADLYALELGDDGYPIRPNNTILITSWDGTWPAYNNSVATNATGSQWLVVSMQSDGGRAVLVSGTPIGPARWSDAGLNKSDSGAGGRNNGYGGSKAAENDEATDGSGCTTAAARSTSSLGLFALLAIAGAGVRRNRRINVRAATR